MTFQIHGLPEKIFEPLFDLSDPSVAFFHIHNAKQDCSTALATRPGEFETVWRGKHAHRLAQAAEIGQFASSTSHR